MARDKLVPYWVRLRPKKEIGSGAQVDESDYFDLTDFANENEGFPDFETFAHYLKNRLEKLQDEGHKQDSWSKTLTVRQAKYAGPGHPLSTRNGHTIEAVIGYGRYGRSSDHLDANNLDNPDVSPDDVREENARDSGTSAEDRLYFLLHIPGTNPTRGITVFHKYGNTSAKSTLHHFLNTHLHDCYEPSETKEDQGLKFEMNTITSKSLAEQLVRDKIRGFELVKRKVPAEAYARESEVFGNTRDTKVSVSVKTKEMTMDRDGVNNLLSRVQSNDYPFAEIVEDIGDDDSIDRINALVETSDGRNRKRQLTRDKLTMEQFINEDIDYDLNTNRPIMSSIGKIARELVNDQLSSYDDGSLPADDSLLQSTDLDSESDDQELERERRVIE